MSSNGRLIRTLALRRVDDSRGTLLPIEFDELPFVPRRIFVVSGVPEGCERGGHAHKTCQQILVAIGGRIELTVRSRQAEATCLLQPWDPAVWIPAGLWARQTYLDRGSALLVLASEPYHPDSYLAHPEEITDAHACLPPADTPQYG